MNYLALGKFREFIMDEIVLGIDSLSNIASCNHEKYINFVEKCSPIYIETSGGLVVLPS